MAKEYRGGTVTGNGVSSSRQNEITADLIAEYRNKVFGWEYGVINVNNPFSETHDETACIIGKGALFAYGYIGYQPAPQTFYFYPTAATQYRFIYGEIDRSVVPNTFALKVKNNQGSSVIKPTTFRQDVLSTVKTGVFQLPLYMVELNNTGIANITNIFNNIEEPKKSFLRSYPKKVSIANATHEISKNVGAYSKCTTNPDYDDNSKLIATTDFTHKAIRYYIDN